ncbi:MAG: hypothetical protein LBT37_06415 [Lactobacillaceae bacterium]|jgi:hypothetical protein|nr:hypothetical protein [Lactobacillaceae bacterium]
MIEDENNVATLTSNQLKFQGDYNNIKIKDGLVKFEVAFALKDNPNILVTLSENTEKPVMVGMMFAQTELDVD